MLIGLHCSHEQIPPSRLLAHGFDQIVLHHVGQDLSPFIAAFAEHVLPELRA